MSEKITAALAGLDVTNDDQWTAQGLPKVDLIKELVGDDTLTREVITNADPSFTRQALKLRQEAASQPQQPPQDDGEEPEVAPERDWEGEAAGHKAAIEEARAKVDAAQKAVKEAEQAEAEFLAEYNATFPQPSNQEVIQSFLKQQQANRVARVSQANAVNALMAKAPIDKAMERNTDRGRPNFGTP